MPDQVVYQIFPDRFRIGVRREWAREGFHGGNLLGILDSLDYLQALGITTIYLTPIFESPTNHKYDVVDYFSVDRGFGSIDTLRDLIRTLHNRDMRLILDVSLNHTSNHHPWFEAAQRGETPYSHYYYKLKNGAYRCWRDHQHMPELNLYQPGLRQLLFDGFDSVLQYYLRMGIDGWRLDVAPDMGLDVARAIRKAIGKEYPESVLIGEIMSFASQWTADGSIYHGVMNYFFRDSVLAWLQGAISGAQMREGVETWYQQAGHQGSLASWNMLSSHDTPRLATVLGESWQRWLALVAQFTLPGVPLVYYGEEVGMHGGPDPDCRRPMIWEEDRWDFEAVERYKHLIALRRQHAALSRGRLMLLGRTLEGSSLVYLRYTDVPSETALVALNPSPHPLRQTVLLPYSHLYHALPMRNLFLPHDHVVLDAGTALLEVPPHSAACWVPDDGRYRHYTFFK